MKILKPFALAAIAAAAFASLAVATASATTLNLATGYPISSEAEGTTILHPPIGDIECKKSTVSGKTSNEGSATETVSANIEGLSFTECNATVTVLAKGSLEIHTRTESANNNGTLTSSGAEVTVEFAGFHCIFKTSSTDIGTLTGSATTSGNATLDIEATIPRTGGRSGAFCGSTAKWTGSYKVTAPSVLNVDGTSGELVSQGGGAAAQHFTGTVGKTYNIEWQNISNKKLTVTKDENTNPAVVKTEGVQCGEIAVGGACKTRSFECIAKGQSELKNYEGVPVIGLLIVTCV